jgi:hypothetical protein
MIKTLLLLLLVVASSCSKTHELKKRNGINYFENVESKIDILKHVEWDVGKKKDKVVSRGMRLSVSVPRMDSNAKKVLRRKHKIESWIFRYSKTYRGKSTPLGHVFYHFDNISGNAKSFSVNIYYHASVVSDKFRAFKCPAFNHRKYLPDVEISERQGARPENIFVRTMGRVKSKVLRLGFKPHIFSIGRDMIGDYTVDFALYDSKSKKRHSIWSKVQGHVVISKERKVTLPSCAGVKEENGPGRSRDSRSYNRKNLQINR